jgi:hypothetical protein
MVYAKINLKTENISDRNLKRRCRIFRNNNYEKTNTKARLCEREWSTDRASGPVVV